MTTFAIVPLPGAQNFVPSFLVFTFGFTGLWMYQATAGDEH
jgi:NADH:ubiquinone oxidoreductase subunit 4 (subunit M)